MNDYLALARNNPPLAASRPQIIAQRSCQLSPKRSKFSPSATQPMIVSARKPVIRSTNTDAITSPSRPTS